ncbi:MAG: type I glyceraldehyde-3-phosphate dehydrogenase [Epsilonproteobacteria bacterium]|nr:type I glyceraldehyde-3-phosphate dehydrogenase [Campylobacterota bacterium]
MNIAINGFGRIGRALLRSIFADHQAQQKLNIAAINIGPSKLSAVDHLFKYDSVYGPFHGQVDFKNTFLEINGNKIQIFSESEPEKLPWGKMDINWVVEATGCFRTNELARRHCNAGAGKVLITAPSPDADATVIPGINDSSYNGTQHTVVSLASCTSNAFGPLLQVLQENFGVEQGLMTTIHSYTNDQVLLDVEHTDPRRARAAALNIIPTKTGASKVMTKIFPALEGKLSAQAIRVPTPVGSLIDFTFTSNHPLSTGIINGAFQAASQGSLKSILQYTDQPLVSSDFVGNPYSCIFDSLLTQVSGNMGKVFGWYDNEYGYSCRLKDFLCLQALTK